MKKLLLPIILLFPITALAQAEIPPADLLVQILDLIKSFGGLSWMANIAAIVTLVLSSMKVSVLNDLIWSKLGSFKAWAAPVLGLVVGVLSLGSEGNITLAGVLAYMSAGAGALILHELLDTIKALPGIGSTWVAIIGIIKSILGAKKA